MSFNTLYATPMGRTARGAYIGALIVLLAVAAFYYLRVKGPNGEWVLFTLLYPAFVLHARRLHDMGQTAWLLLLPGAVIGAAIWPHEASRGAFEAPLGLAALVIGAGLALWCCLGKGQADANRFGETVAA